MRRYHQISLAEVMLRDGAPIWLYARATRTDASFLGILYYVCAYQTWLVWVLYSVLTFDPRTPCQPGLCRHYDQLRIMDCGSILLFRMRYALRRSLFTIVHSYLLQTQYVSPMCRPLLLVWGNLVVGRLRLISSSCILRTCPRIHGCTLWDNSSPASTISTLSYVYSMVDISEHTLADPHDTR